MVVASWEEAALVVALMVAAGLETVEALLAEAMMAVVVAAAPAEADATGMYQSRGGVHHIV